MLFVSAVKLSGGVDAWELAEWEAVETAEHIRRGDVTAAEVVEAALARAEAVASLNAVVTATPEQARVTATGARQGTLHGVPTAIKDLAQVEGVRTAWGTAGSGDFISRRSDPSVKALLRTGLVSLGKSATPELGLTGTTEPLAFGPCRNPWAPAHSTGGSSGGAAALVAAGVVPIAHGSDGGGSLRIPASCCGLVALKVTRGRFDMEGSSLLPVNIAVHGVLSRTVRDTVAFWRALEAVRPETRRPTPLGDIATAPAQRLTLGMFVESPTGSAVHSEVRAAVESTAAVATSLGHEVRAIACPFSAQVVHDFVRLWSFVAWSQTKIARLAMHRGFDVSKLEPFTRGFASSFAAQPLAALAAIRRLRGFARRYAELIAPYDVVLGPTLAEPPPLLGHLATDQPFEATLERLLTFTPFTGLVNAAGAPALSLPAARSTTGLPLGVQLAASHGREATLLELAAELEAARPWPKIAPRLLR